MSTPLAPAQTEGVRCVVYYMPLRSSSIGGAVSTVLKIRFFRFHQDLRGLFVVVFVIVDVL